MSVGPDHMVRLRAPEGAIWRSDRSAPVVTYSDEMAYAFSWSDVLWHWAEQKGEAFYSYLKTHRPDAFDAVLACVEEETGTPRDTIATNILDNLVALNDCLAKLYNLDLSSLFDVAVHGAHAHAAVKHLGITGQVFVNVKGGVEYLITKGYAGQRPAGSAIVGTRYKLNNPKLRMFAFSPLNELGKFRTVVVFGVVFYGSIATYKRITEDDPELIKIWTQFGTNVVKITVASSIAGAITRAIVYRALGGLVLAIPVVGLPLAVLGTAGISYLDEEFGWTDEIINILIFQVKSILNKSE